MVDVQCSFSPNTTCIALLLLFLLDIGIYIESGTRGYLKKCMRLSKLEGQKRIQPTFGIVSCGIVIVHLSVVFLDSRRITLTFSHFH
jgi:hypothetical protein